MRDTCMIDIRFLAKTFVLHLMDHARLPIVADVCLQVHKGECVVLGGPSGVGKSSILKMVYGNYRCDAGQILVRHDGGILDVAHASPRQILGMRDRSVGYVSQFLRAIPRVSSIDIVKTQVRNREIDGEARAAELLTRLSVPEHLWRLAPATFSGGEQQRINIARGFAADHPVLLLDEPTASLDRRNRQAVIDLIQATKSRGAAILAIFHDEAVREALADRIVNVQEFAPTSNV